MPPQNALPTTFAGHFAQAHILPCLGTRDDAVHQSGHLGLFRKPASLSISLVSPTLAWKSSSSKGPKRPTFSHAAFLADAPAPRTGICSILSPLRSLRFLLPLLGSAQNRWRGRHACGTLHQKNPASQRVAAAARVNHGGSYAKLE